MFTSRSITGTLHRLGFAALVLLCSGFAISAWADPPGRVGRLSDIDGQVWLYSPDQGEWVTAPRNRPLTNGDRLSTDTGARAEVRIGSTTVRVDSGTELEILRIDDERVALQLHSGTLSARLRNAEAANEFELVTTEGRFQVQRPGRYRFDRLDDASHLTVWSGQATYEGPGSALTVNPGQHAEFWLSGNNAAQYSITEPVRDAFAAWNGERDRSDDRSASTRYVSPEMTGVEDLDRYGRWDQTPEYGAIWIPRAVPVGWAPYGFGHWVWVSPWGWTWVDDQPWGFAPFHYGRWAMYRDRWCWVPGSYVRRPVYAPALVAWVGGPHLSVSISIGGRGPAPVVGWLPLAPREVFVPSYRVSPHYVQQVNITHVTNITNVTTIVNNPQTVVANTDYANRRFPHAVTVVPQTVLANRQPVAPVAAQLRNNPVVREIATQPVQRFAVAAPPVGAPPAAVAARRMHEQRRESEASRPGAPAVVTAPPVVVPPSPPARAAIARENQPQNPRAAAALEQRRGRENREESRGVPPSPPSRVTTTVPQAPQVQAAPPQAAAAPVAPPLVRSHPAPAAAPPAEVARPAPPAQVVERPVPPPPHRGRPEMAPQQAQQQQTSPAPQPQPQVAAPQPQAVVPVPPQRQAPPAPPSAAVVHGRAQEAQGRGRGDAPPPRQAAAPQAAPPQQAVPPQPVPPPPPQAQAQARENPRAEEQRKRKAEEQRAREEQRREREKTN